MAGDQNAFSFSFMQNKECSFFNKVVVVGLSTSAAAILVQIKPTPNMIVIGPASFMKDVSLSEQEAARPICER